MKYAIEKHRKGWALYRIDKKTEKRTRLGIYKTMKAAEVRMNLDAKNS